jgi:hypothetical protein
MLAIGLSGVMLITLIVVLVCHMLDSPDVGILFGLVVSCLVLAAFVAVAVDLWCYSSIVDVSPAGITVDRGIPGLRCTTTIAREDVAGIAAEFASCDTQQFRRRIRYRVVARLKQGPSVLLARRLESKQAAEVVARRMDQSLCGDSEEPT